MSDPARRSFLRWSVGGAIAAALGALVWRRPGPPPGETCVSQGLCRGCRAYDGCGLPAARSMREATSR